MKTVIRNSYTPKIGDYCETIVVDKETENAYIFDCDGIFTEVPQPVDVEKILEEAAAYTDEQVAPLAEKLDTIEEGAQVNKIEHVLRNGAELTITNKTVNVTVPTKTSDLTNDGSDGTDTYVESDTLDDYYTKDETDTQIGYETDAREIADAGLQEQIDAIVASSDVVDIVGTYAALQSYDTSTLSANDIIKVLTDESRDDATTYYRWTGSTWLYIGAEGPFYTKAESDAIFTPMTRTINNKALSSDITITAQDVGALPDSTVIPTVNDATLTIQKNGTTVQTFTANQATNATANITVPTDTSDLTNDGDGQSPFATEDYVDTYGGKIDTIEVNGTAQPIVNKTVDITVPTKTSDLTNDGSDGTDTYIEAGDLATVATTGDYDDLTNKPTIPTVNDATLTIQKNGTDVATFTANSASAATANITVPTDTSDLTNGAGFITTSALSDYYTKSETYSQQEVNSLINTLSIPTKTSDLTNDGSDGTSAYVEADGLAAVATSGSYNDLLNKPTIPSYSDFTGATSGTAGAHGLVPAPAAGDEGKFLQGDGTWATVQSGGSDVLVLYTDYDFGNNLPTTWTSALQPPVSFFSDEAMATPITPDDLFAMGSASGAALSVLIKAVPDPNIIEHYQASLDLDDFSDRVNLMIFSGQGGTMFYIAGFCSVGAQNFTGGVQIHLQYELTAGSNISIVNDTISASFPVDSALSVSSTNPVQNSVITAALNRKNKTIWTAYNISPSTNTPTSWKTALDGEGIYWTWYDTANTFTNQPSRYGLLRTVIGAGDVRQDFYAQTSGQHYYRTGNATGWYGQSGNAGNFRYLGDDVDTALSTTSNNPVKNRVVTTALNEKVNCKRSYTTATTLNYKKITVVGGTYATDGAGIILFTREERYIIDGMCASGYGGKCIELGTNHNANNTSASTSNRWVNIKVYGVPESRTTEIYCRMSPYTYVDVHSSGTITITDIDEATWTAATNNSTYIPLLDEGPGSYWGTCTTAAATAAKVVTVSAAQNFRLEVGAMVTFKAPNTNTAQNPTINVNSTGAKPVFFDNAVITTGNLNKAGQNGRPATYIYDGTNWVWVSWSKDDSTTYSTMSVSEGTTGTATTARTMRADYLKQIIEHYTPTVNNATLTVTQNGTSVGTFTANSSTDTTLALTDTTYSDFTGATSSVAGAHGLVPAPTTSDTDKYLKGDGTWATVTAPPSVTVTSTPATSYSGASSTDAMSQLGTYRQVHADNDGVQIGGGGVAANVGSVTTAADYSSAHCIAIGGGATVADAFSGHGRIAIGDNAKANRTNSVAIGAYSFASGGYGTTNSVAIGTCARTSTTADYNTVIGGHAYSAGKFATVIGSGKRTNPTQPNFNAADTCAAVLADYGVAVGTQAQVLTGCTNSVALGYHSKTGRKSEVSIGDGSSGTAYGLRYLANVKDGALATDAATVGQLPTAMTGATSSTAGTSGLVPAPAAGDEGKYLKGDGTWGGEVTIRLLADPMSSDSVNITDDMTAALPTSQLYFSALFSDDVNRVVYKNYDMDAGNFTSYKYYTIVNKYTDAASNSGTCTLVDDSGTTIVLSGSLGSTTAAKTITVTRPINSEEVIYNYTQASNSSANVDVDAPIDLTTYREIRIVAFDISTKNGTWMTFTPMDSTKSSRTTYLHGYEIINSTISAVNRSDTQCGAVSIGADGVGGVETIIERGGVDDWTAFQTHGFGEGSVQSVGGLIKAAASGTAYVRVRLVSPKAGSRVTVYGKR